MSDRDKCNEICGDGIRVSATTTCDDNNTDAKDGCDENC
ncbi:hypothetical protein COB52_05840 [Candidatus Kaiserbacteria bacterium]|nr:MAG: hypothetical protein COB52_05840 [Candidatus Kaiserbacteria bacterium]